MKTNKDRHILSERRKSPAWTLVSGDIRFVRIFGQVLLKEDVKGQWGQSRVNARLALCVNISETVRDTFVKIV